MMDYYTWIRETWKMAAVKHHYPFRALMRQLSELTGIKRAINIGEVQRYCGGLEQDERLPRAWGFFMLVLFPVRRCHSSAMPRSLKSNLMLGIAA